MLSNAQCSDAQMAQLLIGNNVLHEQLDEGLFPIFDYRNDFGLSLYSQQSRDYDRASKEEAVYSSKIT